MVSTTTLAVNCDAHKSIFLGSLDNLTLHTAHSCNSSNHISFPRQRKKLSNLNGTPNSISILTGTQTIEIPFFNFIAATHFICIGMFNPNLLLLSEPYVSGYHANHVVFSITLIKTPSRPSPLLVWQILKRWQMECEGCYILCPSIYLHVYVFEGLFTQQSICHSHSLCTSSLCPLFLSHCITDFIVEVWEAKFCVIWNPTVDMTQTEGLNRNVSHCRWKCPNHIPH